MNSFIPWVGGKSKLLWIINKMAPDHYSRFIDVFGGSGTVTMSRPIQPGCMEVYNDFNSNLTNLFCCVKNRPLRMYFLMRDWSQPLLWRLRPFLFLLTTSGVSVSIPEYSLSPASCP